jgi:hypothetical protein
MLHVTDEFVQSRQLVTLDVGALVACLICHDLSALYLNEYYGLGHGRGPRITRKSETLRCKPQDTSEGPVG